MSGVSVQYGARKCLVVCNGPHVFLLCPSTRSGVPTGFLGAGCEPNTEIRDHLATESQKFCACLRAVLQRLLLEERMDYQWRVYTVLTLLCTRLLSCCLERAGRKWAGPHCNRSHNIYAAIAARRYMRLHLLANVKVSVNLYMWARSVIQTNSDLIIIMP